MTDTRRQGLHPKQTFIDSELREINELARVCEAHDQVDLRINWGGLEERAGDRASDFLYYHNGALIGFLAIDGLGDDEAEATGMVHPNHRRQGVFRALAAAAGAECRSAGTAALVFVFDRRSDSARGFVDALGAVYVFAEHKMRWPGTSAIPNVEPRLDFRRATADDAAAIAGILAEDIGIDAHELRQAVADNIRHAWYRYYVAALGAVPVGTLNVQTLDRDAYIYGFV
ncbi:MAG TPA: GNAT family N-acetyltransferase, partial [Roseiflexaceae bacterium]